MPQSFHPGADTLLRLGDQQNADSGVAQLRREPHEYALVGELGTKPRTTYLARVRSETE